MELASPGTLWLLVLLAPYVAIRAGQEGRAALPFACGGPKPDPASTSRWSAHRAGENVVAAGGSFSALAADLAGVIEGPEDLSSNKAHLDDYGR